MNLMLMEKLLEYRCTLEFKLDSISEEDQRLINSLTVKDRNGEILFTSKVVSLSEIDLTWAFRPNSPNDRTEQIEYIEELLDGKQEN